MAHRVSELNLTVDVLVNSAGFATAGTVRGLPRSREVEMVRTNAEAVVDLCATYVPAMADRGFGRVLNVASIVAFHPSPGTATYAATKAFILSFTEALEELRGTGVTATVLCPGAVRTAFHDVAAGAGGAIRNRIASIPDFLWLESTRVAEAGVDGMFAGRRVVIPGVAYKVSAVALAHLSRGPLLRGIRKVLGFEASEHRVTASTPRSRPASRGAETND
jgi:hypothetical protein